MNSGGLGGKAEIFTNLILNSWLKSLNFPELKKWGGWVTAALRGACSKFEKNVHAF